MFPYCASSPVAELQHVASSYGFPPVKVVTLRNEPQVMNTLCLAHMTIPHNITRASTLELWNCQG